MNLRLMLPVMALMGLVGYAGDRVDAARAASAKRDEQQTGQWSVRFPNHARLVYDADTRTCFCEGSLQDAFDGVVNSMKWGLNNCERRLYGDKQVNEWEAEAKKREFRWP